MSNNQPTAAEVAAYILAPIEHDSAQARSEKVLYIARHAAILATGYLGTKDKLDHLEDASTLYYQQSSKQLEDARVEIERLRFALHAVGFALGGKDLAAGDVDNECLRFNVGTALKYITNTEQGLDVFGRAPGEKGGEG